MNDLVVAARSETSASSTIEAITEIDATVSTQAACGSSRRDVPSGNVIQNM